MSLKMIRNDAIHFLSVSVVLCSNNVAILHCFRDITTFAVYVTAGIGYPKPVMKPGASIP